MHRVRLSPATPEMSVPGLPAEDAFETWAEAVAVTRQRLAHMPCAVRVVPMPDWRLFDSVDSLVAALNALEDPTGRHLLPDPVAPAPAWEKTGVLTPWALAHALGLEPLATPDTPSLDPVIQPRPRPA